MNKGVVVFGTGSFAQCVKFYLTNDSDYEVVAFTVTADHIEAPEFEGLPLVPFESIESKYPPAEYGMFVAAGYRDLNRMRAGFYERAKAKGYELITYISSKCTYWGNQIGDNCFIFEDNTVQPFGTIGNNVVLWSGNHIGHHVSIGDHTFIAAHVVISGHVTIGTHCFVGVNSTFRDAISIGNYCIIGAGAIVMKSTGDKKLLIAPRTVPDTRSVDEINF